MGEFALRVNGKEFGGWKTIRLTRGIEAIAGGFDVSVSERWVGQREAWPIHEEDECAVAIDGEVVLTGYVDKRSVAAGKMEHSLRVSGRDKAAALVDCSAMPAKWEFRNLSWLQLAQQIADPFGVSVSLAAAGPTALPAPPAKFTIDPGERAFDVLDRLCRLAGVLPVSDGMGGIVLTRAGSARATTALVQGQNILGITADYDATARFRRYVVKGQHQGSKDWSGKAVSAVSGEARDETVRRSSRTLLIRPEAGVTRASAKLRAEWEAKVRAARGDAVTVTVQGWRQADGALWPVNALVSLRSSFVGMDAELLITQAVYAVDGEGTTTQLTLKRPDAFVPEAVVTKPGKGNGYWAEIVRGV